MNALFIQWLAGDLRECLGDDVDPLDVGNPDTENAWAEYAKDSESGRVSSRLFRSSCGSTLYFDISR